MKTSVRGGFTALGAAAIAVTALVSCSSDSGTSTPSQGTGGFPPVSIENTFGTTTIDSKPERSSPSDGTRRTSCTHSI